MRPRTGLARRSVPRRQGCLAVGDDVADRLTDLLGDRGADGPVARAPDVHAALLSLVEDGPRAVVVSPPQLLPRPRAALRALTKAASPCPVVLLSPGRGEPRSERAATAMGVPCVREAGSALAILPASSATSPSSASSPREPATPPAARRPRRLRDIAFVDRCFQRLDRPDDLCRFVVSSFAKVSGAGRVTLMLVDAERASLFIKAARGLDAALVGRVRVPASSGVAGRAATLGRAVVGRAVAGGARGYTGTAYAVLPLGPLPVGGAPPRCEGVLALTDLPGDALPGTATVRRWVRRARRAGQALSVARRIEQAESLSATDELTGLPNRRAFLRALHREVERARRAGDAVAVGLLDVDHFKAVNDRFGHPVGDRVLAQVARRLSGALRETDLVARFGGEEFAVLLTGLQDGTAAEALSVLERARTAVGGRPLALGPGLPCPVVTISGGVAVLPQDGLDGATLVHKADAALYAAKAAGRNQVHHA